MGDTTESSLARPSLEAETLRRISKPVIAKLSEQTGNMALVIHFDGRQIWLGTKARAREWSLVENRYEPTTIHLKTYVDDRYKLTVYCDRPHGELFDLVDDPGEIRNLWDSPGHQQLKNELVTKLLFVEMGKEQLWMPCIAGA